MKTWANWLSDQLTLRGWTARELAKRCRPPISEGTVSRWLSGKTEPGHMARALVERALGERWPG